MAENVGQETNEIEPGMLVEADEGDLGESDISKPKVSKVIQNAQGEVEKIIIKKGVLFQKEIEVEASRIQKVGPLLELVSNKRLNS